MTKTVWKIVILGILLQIIKTANVIQEDYSQKAENLNLNQILGSAPQEIDQNFQEDSYKQHRLEYRKKIAQLESARQKLRANKTCPSISPTPPIPDPTPPTPKPTPVDPSNNNPLVKPSIAAAGLSGLDSGIGPALYVPIIILGLLGTSFVCALLAMRRNRKHRRVRDSQYTGGSQSKIGSSSDFGQPVHN